MQQQKRNAGDSSPFDFAQGQNDEHRVGILEADVDDGKPLRDADLRRGETDALRGVHGLEHLIDELLELRIEDCDGLARPGQHGVGPLYNFMYLFQCFAHSIRSNLLAIAIEVSLQLTQRVTAEFLYYQPRYGERDHRLCRDASGWDDTDVAALVGCLDGLAGLEADAGEGPAEGGDGLEVAAHDDVFSVGDATFDASGVVPLAREFSEGLVRAFVAD